MTIQDTTLINGRYHLCGVSGRGGWGIIYRAKDVETGQEYAVKMSRQALEHRGMNELLEELELVQRIDHAGIINYHDYGMHDHRPVIIMELLNAPSLYEYIQSTSLGEHEKFSILYQICDAVKAMHTAQVIHCDLKPQNIMVVQDEGIKIVDFGLAKGINQAGYALRQTIGGTPNLMAPEQLVLHHHLTCGSDVYAVALIAVWLFTGELNWPCDGLELLRWRSLHPDALPTSLEKLSPDIKEVLLSALTLELSERVHDIDQLKRRLERVAKNHRDPLPFLLSPMPINPYGYPPTKEDSAFQTTILHTLDTAEIFSDNYDALILNPQQVDSIMTVGLITCMKDHGSDRRETSDTILSKEYQKSQALRLGITEDLIDLLNVSPELTLAPFSRSKSMTFSSTWLSPSIDWDALQPINTELDATLLICIELDHDCTSIHFDIVALSIEDQLILSHLEMTVPYQDLLNQLGSIAYEITQALKVTFNRPAVDRVNIAESLDLLFAARLDALNHWHSDVSNARELYRKALSYAPNDAIISAEVARVIARSSFIGPSNSRGDLAEAVELAEQAHQQVPHHPKTLWALGYVRFYEGKQSEALSLLNQALKLGADRIEIRDLIGRILCEIGPIDDAIPQLEYVLSSEPTQMTTRFDLARLHAYKGNWAQVDELLSFIPESDSDFGALAITRARIDLWRPTHAVWVTDRDLQREGSFFQPFIDLFYTVKQQKCMTDIQRVYLDQCIENAPENSRIRILYYQFLAECLAYIYGPDDRQVLEGLALAHDAGLSDQIWLKYCPLLSKSLSEERYAVKKDMQ